MICAALLIFALTVTFPLLIHCAWMVAPLAAPAGGRIWRVIYSAFRRPGRSSRELFFNIRIRLTSRAERIAAWGAAIRLFTDIEKRIGVSGGGNGAAAPPDDSPAQQNPPLWTGPIL